MVHQGDFTKTACVASAEVRSPVLFAPAGAVITKSRWPTITLPRSTRLPVQTVEEALDESVCNLHLCPPWLAGGVVPRAGERLSLTVRRVPRVIKGLMGLAGRR